MAIEKLPGFQNVYKGGKDPLTGEVAKTRYAINPLTGVRLNVRDVATIQHGGISYERYIKENNLQPAYYKPRAGTGAIPKPRKPRGPIAAAVTRIKNRVQRRKGPDGKPIRQADIPGFDRKAHSKYAKRYNKAYDRFLANYDAEHGTNYRDTLDIPDDIAREFHKDYHTVLDYSNEEPRISSMVDVDDFSDSWDDINFDYEVDSYDERDWQETP